MHILVATDGTLDSDAAVGLVSRIHRPDDEVTVFTALDFPRDFLQSYAEVCSVQEVAEIAKAAGPGMLNIASGAKAAERMVASSKPRGGGPVPDLDTYFSTVAHQRCSPLEQKLSAAGITAERAYSPTEGQTAASILAVITARDVDLLLIGTHGRGRFEGQLGATVTKIMRHAPIPVLLVR